MKRIISKKLLGGLVGETLEKLACSMHGPIFSEHLQWTSRNLRSISRPGEFTKNNFRIQHKYKIYDIVYRDLALIIQQSK
jgi:hypothetical protein